MGLLFIERSLFLSTPSARRATAAGCSASSTTTDFYPRPPRGGRPRYIPTLSVDSVFLSTPSARRATRSGARPQQLRHISIHALREEGDGRRCPWPSLERHFYPRPPRGGRLRSRPLRSSGFDFYPRPPRGGRRTTSATTSCVAYFYPRPPRGGRLFKDQELTQVIDDFYPRPPRGGRREVLVENYSLRYISIHALREEGDD